MLQQISINMIKFDLTIIRFRNMNLVCLWTWGCYERVLK